MKKRREWPWFVIPFVLLPVCSALSSLLSSQAVAMPEFIGNEHYIKLLMADPMFWVSVGITQFSFWGIGAVLALVLGPAVHLLQRWMPMSRRLRYIVVFGAATLITMIVWLVGVRLIPTIYNILFFVQIGNASTLFVWLAEKVVQAIRNRKRTCVSEVS